MFSLKSILETSFSIHANAFSLQISKPLLIWGAGGRGEALRSAPTPQGYRACPERFSALLQVPVWFSGPEGSGASAPSAGPPTFFPQIWSKIELIKGSESLTPNWLPKELSKSKKSYQICKMATSNSFWELLWPLSLQKRFSSHPPGPPKPQQS